MIPCSTCNTPATHVHPETVSARCAAHATQADRPLTHADRRFWYHALEVISEHSDVSIYLLRPASGGLMESVHVAFLPHGYIALYGDSAPGRRRLDFHGAYGAAEAERADLAVPGMTSDRGYGPGWFASTLSRNYLCEKFLATMFRPDLAAECLRETATEREEDERESRSGVLSPDELRERADEVAAIEPHSEWELLEWQARFHRDERSASDVLEGAHGYDVDNADQLCAIQLRFRALWLPREKALEAARVGRESAETESGGGVSRQPSPA